MDRQWPQPKLASGEHVSSSYSASLEVYNSSLQSVKHIYFLSQPTDVAPRGPPKSARSPPQAFHPQQSQGQPVAAFPSVCCARLTLVLATQPNPSPIPPTLSGPESDSESVLAPPPDVLSNATSLSSMGASGSFIPGTSPHPLSSIIERRSGSGDESDEEEDGEEGGWRTADVKGKPRGSTDETVIKAGYLSKKGERRKVRFPLTYDHGADDSVDR